MSTKISYETVANLDCLQVDLENAMHAFYLICTETMWGEYVRATKRPSAAAGFIDRFPMYYNALHAMESNISKVSTELRRILDEDIPYHDDGQDKQKESTV
jgi:hypothetical protein